MTRAPSGDTGEVMCARSRPRVVIPCVNAAGTTYVPYGPWALTGDSSCASRSGTGTLTLVNGEPAPTG